MKTGFKLVGCRVRRSGQSITTILGVIMLFGAGWLSGATFDVWLVIPSGPISSNAGFAVEVWGEMHGTDAIGLSDFAVTIASTKTGFVQPQAASGQFIAMSWGEEMWRFALKIPAARSDLEGDGDADAVQFAAGDINYSAFGLATNAPVLLATEFWTMLGDGTKDCDALVPTVAPTSRFWNGNSNRVQFAGYQTTSAAAGVASPGSMRISDVRLLKKGGLQLTVTGATPGHTYLVEACTDLQNWLPIATNVPVASVFGVIDGDTSNLNFRFYRVVGIP